MKPTWNRTEQWALSVGLGLLLPVGLAGAQDASPPETTGLVDRDSLIESLGDILPPGAVSPADLFLGVNEPWTDTSVIFVAPDGAFVWVENFQSLDPELAAIDLQFFADAGAEEVSDSDLSSLLRLLGPSAIPEHRFEAAQVLTDTVVQEGWRVTVSSRQSIVEMNGLWAEGWLITIRAEDRGAAFASSEPGQDPVHGEVRPAGDEECDSPGLGTAYSSSSRLEAASTGDERPLTVEVLPEMTLFVPVSYSWDRTAAVSRFEARAGEGAFDIAGHPVVAKVGHLVGPVGETEDYGSACFANYELCMDRAEQKRISCRRAAVAGCLGICCLRRTPNINYPCRNWLCMSACEGIELTGCVIAHTAEEYNCAAEYRLCNGLVDPS